MPYCQDLIKIILMVKIIENKKFLLTIDLIDRMC